MRRGFTIIELLLYTSASAIVLLGVSIFFSVVAESRVKNSAVAEVEQQGIQVMQFITQAVRNANDVTSPLPGTASFVLSLSVADQSKNPTVFDNPTGTLRVTEGVNQPIALTSSRVTVSGLIFENLARPNTSGIVRIRFTLAHVNPQNKSEFGHMQTFYGSAVLR